MFRQQGATIMQFIKNKISLSPAAIRPNFRNTSSQHDELQISH